MVGVAQTRHYHSRWVFCTQFMIISFSFLIFFAVPGHLYNYSLEDLYQSLGSFSFAPCQVQKGDSHLLALKLSCKIVLFYKFPLKLKRCKSDNFT